MGLPLQSQSSAKSAKSHKSGTKSRKSKKGKEKAGNQVFVKSTYLVEEDDVIESVCTSISSYSKNSKRTENTKRSVNMHETDLDEKSSKSMKVNMKAIVNEENWNSNSRNKNGARPSVSKIIADLNRAVTLDDRIPAIHAACKEFDHFNQDRHKKEIELGAVSSIYQKLCLALTVRNGGGRHGEEIAMICAALEMVYRVSKQAREPLAVFYCKEVFPILLRIITMFKKDESFEGDLAIESSLKILFYFSRVKNSAITMVGVNGFLKSLTDIILGDKNDSIRKSALITLADLACVEENGENMARFPTLLESVLVVATNDLDQEVREVAARVIQNITFSLEEDISQDLQAALVDALVRLSSDGTKTRKYVAGALQNLSSGEIHRLFLISRNDGAVLGALLSFMTCDDSDVRSRAVGVLKNLCCQETAAVIGGKVEILTHLTEMCVSDPNVHVRTDAMDTITWLADDISHPSDCHNDLLYSLVHIAQNSEEFTMSSAFLKQSCQNENKDSLAFHPGLLDVLEKISFPDSNSAREDKKNAIIALKNIAGRQ